ncbi:MAG: cyclic 2,3-diphosphoglycerate synthase [Alphaproteobacteria bacterium]
MPRNVASDLDRVRTVIMGAAGRDFHTFNVCYRADPTTDVVAFTAAQIPGIAERRYPPELAGALYPNGIPIFDESLLEEICHRHDVTRVVFAYSDVTHQYVMHAASRALAAGADFELIGPSRSMLPTRRPTIAVCGVRTGVGKSQTSRWIAARLRARGLRCVVVRHPMPYGDLKAQIVQRFASYADLAAASCTVEEREEYEPHLAAGSVVFAGVDYAQVLTRAEAEADIVLWDGGNNDFPFVRPGLSVALVDATRPGHETEYHPGETVLRMADVVVIAKTNIAQPGNIESLAETVRQINPRAKITMAASIVTLLGRERVRGKRVLVIEDGPTITHGGKATGAGYAAALDAGVGQIVDPRPYASPPLAEVYTRFPHIGPVLPAIGYSAAQVQAIAETIAAAPVDCVISGTPIDLENLVSIGKPVARARYDFVDGDPPLENIIDEFLRGISPET